MLNHISKALAVFVCCLNTTFSVCVFCSLQFTATLRQHKCNPTPILLWFVVPKLKWNKNTTNVLLSGLVEEIISQETKTAAPCHVRFGPGQSFPATGSFLVVVTCSRSCHPQISVLRTPAPVSAGGRSSSGRMRRHTAELLEKLLRQAVLSLNRGLRRVKLSARWLKMLCVCRQRGGAQAAASARQAARDGCTCRGAGGRRCYKTWWCFYSGRQTSNKHQVLLLRLLDSSERRRRN